VQSRPATPPAQGKVEQGGAHYGKRNFLAGRTLRDPLETNTLVLTWCRETAGPRSHGTTKECPLERFTTVEQAALLPLPVALYALAIWKRAKLHPDCHVVFAGAFSSAPHRLIGKPLWVRAADTTVTLFHEHELVAWRRIRGRSAQGAATPIPITSRPARSWRSWPRPWGASGGPASWGPRALS
jgi:hypothetical protein